MKDHQYTEEEHRAWLTALPKKSIAAKVIIKSNLNNILLVKPSYLETWQLPGGGVDAKEDPKEAAVRELKEELGLVIDTTKLKLIDTVFRRELENLILVYEYTGTIEESHELNPDKEEIIEYAFEKMNKVASLLGDFFTEFWHNYTT